MNWYYIPPVWVGVHPEQRALASDGNVLILYFRFLPLLFPLLLQPIYLKAQTEFSVSSGGGPQGVWTWLGSWSAATSGKGWQKGGSSSNGGFPTSVKEANSFLIFLSYPGGDFWRIPISGHSPAAAAVVLSHQQVVQGIIACTWAEWAREVKVNIRRIENIVDLLISCGQNESVHTYFMLLWGWFISPLTWKLSLPFLSLTVLSTCQSTLSCELSGNMWLDTKPAVCKNFLLSQHSTFDRTRLDLIAIHILFWRLLRQCDFSCRLWLWFCNH